MQLHLLDDDVVAPRPVDLRGVNGPTPNQSRGPRWRRVAAGLFVPSSVDPNAAPQRIVEAVAGALPGAAATGWAALHWWGAPWFEGRAADGSLEPVPVALGDRSRRAGRRGVRYVHDWLFETDVVTHRGLPVVGPERAVCQEALRARGLEQAVQVLDMAAASDLVSLEEMAEYAQMLGPRPGIRRLRAALGLAEENVWSPMEVTMRLRWITRYPSAALRCNAPIFSTSGEHLLTPDLVDPATGVVGEYDGAVHDETRVRRRDLEREERARDHGLVMVSMTSRDLRDIHSFERRLVAAYERQRGRQPSNTWTLQHPPGWRDLSTVLSRRARAAEIGLSS